MIETREAHPVKETPEWNPSVNKDISYRFAMQHGIFITHVGKEQVEGVYRAGCSPYAIVELKRKYGVRFRLELVTQEAFLAYLEKKYSTSAAEALKSTERGIEQIDFQKLSGRLHATNDILESVTDSPVITLINSLLQQAINKSASDIHFEPFAGKMMIRIRVDGILHNILEIPEDLAALLVSRIKIISSLDIAEKRLPQDGRISIVMLNRSIDIRVSTIPVVHGERVVLRILNKATAPLALSDLGMSDRTLSAIRRLIARPHGIILVTGPTGCGKTTTLYAVLAEIFTPGRNLMTVEDPVEFDLPGIAQIQVNEKSGVTFAASLRSILRQDPNIIMVGEIRDLETANMAIQASLTGQLILSTLHTNSAAAAIIRLQEMGAQSFYLASSLIGVLAQRLVRLLCKYCRQPHPPGDEERQFLGLAADSKQVIYSPRGCDHCNQTGYSHRIGIFEIIEVDDMFREMIYQNKPLFELEAYLKNKSATMAQDGIARVLSGETSINEVMRVASSQ